VADCLRSASLEAGN